MLPANVVDQPVRYAGQAGQLFQLAAIRLSARIDEVKGAPLAVLATHQMSAHQALMLRADWSEDVTLIAGDIGTEDMTRIRQVTNQCSIKALQ